VGEPLARVFPRNRSIFCFEALGSILEILEDNLTFLTVTLVVSLFI